jgi:hypothetical protein
VVYGGLLNKVDATKLFNEIQAQQTCSNKTGASVYSHEHYFTILEVMCYVFSSLHHKSNIGLTLQYLGGFSFETESAPAFFEKLGLTDENGVRIPRARLAAHDVLLAPPGEVCRDLVLTSGSTDEISVLVRTRREVRRKATSASAEEERANGTARQPGNGRAYRRLPEETLIQESDQSRPGNVQVAKKGRLQRKAVTHRSTRPAPRSAPPFTPQEEAAVTAIGTDETSNPLRNTKRPRAERNAAAGDSNDSDYLPSD